MKKDKFCFQERKSTVFKQIMKSRIRLIIIISLLIFAGWACKNNAAEELVAFADDDLRELLCKVGIDINHDGFISVWEATDVTKITILAADVTDLGGLEAFPALDSLVLKMVPIEQMNLSGIRGLRYLECTMCNLKNMILSANINLEEIICDKNQIDTIILPSGPALKTLHCGYNRLRNIDLSGATALTSLHCNNNILTSINLSNNHQLTQMISCGNQLTSLDVSANSSITSLGVDNMPMLSVVYVWTLPFPPSGVNVLMSFSPQIKFDLPKQLP